MKIRNGFVSNSSSSSFIVIMGKGFNPTDEEIQNAIYDSGYDEVTVQYIKDRIEEVKKGRSLYDYDSYSHIRIISELCVLKDIILETIDVGSDRGSLSNVLHEKNLPKIKKAIEENEE